VFCFGLLMATLADGIAAAAGGSAGLDNL